MAEIAINSHIGMMCAKKYAVEIGRAYSWVLERIKSGAFPLVDADEQNITPMIDLFELNNRIRANKLKLASPRKRPGKKQQAA